MKKLILWDLDGTLINTLEDLAAAVDYALTLRGLPTHSIEEYRKMVGHGVRNLVKQALEASVSTRPTAEEIYFPQGFAENQIPSAIANPTHGSNERPTAGGNYFSQSFAKNQFPSAIATPTHGDAGTGLTDAYIDAALADFREYYEAHIDVHTRPYPGIPELLNKLNAMGVKMAVASNKFQEGTEKLIQEFFPDIAFVSILGNRAGYPLKPDPEIVQEVLRKAGIGPEDAMMVGDSPTDMKTAANGGIDALAVTWGYRTLEELAGNRMVHSVEELDSTLCSE
jgi:phosphoglycolate phosphatase